MIGTVTDVDEAGLSFEKGVLKRMDTVNDYKGCNTDCHICWNDEKNALYTEGESKYSS